MKQCSQCIDWQPIRRGDGCLGRCGIDDRIVHEDEAEYCIEFEEEAQPCVHST